MAHEDNDEDECPHCDILAVFNEYTSYSGGSAMLVYEEMMTGMKEIALAMDVDTRRSLNVVLYATMIEVSNSIALDEAKSRATKH
jgi:hypothetical protein|tara:strand:+ start:784 stop:1038 length:255 start_codon:yes stop_codon:yes gene_type:complete